MIEKIKAYMNKHHMLSAGDTVVAGVSGGADSVCLLFVLKALQQEMDFTLLVVHVNHKIRPEAGEDAAYTERLCKKLQVPFFPVEAEVEKLAEDWKISTEEAGRRVRYEAFGRVLQEQAGEALNRGQAKIAVAHNSDDRAETMLFHLFRGTGIAGLGSIRPVRENVIRPILCLSREEIETFLRSRGISYCIDKTNQEDTYTRNKIRHHILPYAKEHVSEGVLEHMSSTADMMLETEDFLRSVTEEAYERCVRKSAVPQGDSGQEIRLSVSQVLNLHSLIRKRLVLKVIEELVFTKKDIGAVHVRDVAALFEQPGNRQISLPYGICVRREYEDVVFERCSVCRTKKEEEFSLPENETGTLHIPGLGELEFSTFPYEKNMDIPQNQYTKWFDCDKIDKPLKFRNRRTGDYLTINKALSRKSLQDYMVDEKIPKARRDEVWLLAEESHVLWVVGHRISEKYKVSENTKRVLQIQLRGGY